MLSSVAASALNSAFRFPLSTLSQGQATDASPASSEGTDLLSLSQPGWLDGGDTFEERTSVQLRAKSQVRVTDDGDTLATTQAKLRFSYDFQAADGSTIKVRMQANLNYAQLTDDDAESQTTKLRASMHVSVLQQNVASGVAPLLEDPNTSANTQDMISQALDLFQQMTDTATSLFQESNPLDGDSLITSLVDAFNGLSESIESAYLPAPETSEPAGEVIDVPASVEPTEVATSTPDVPAAELPAAELPAVVEVPLPEAASTEAVEETPESTATEETTTPTEEATSEAAASPGASNVPATTAEPTAQQSIARTTILRVRLQVVQSLRGLTSVFDGNSSEQQLSSTLRASAQYSARYGVGVSDGVDGRSHHHHHHRLDTWR